MIRYAENGGAARSRFSDICEKPEGGGAVTPLARRGLLAPDFDGLAPPLYGAPPDCQVAPISTCRPPPENSWIRPWPQSRGVSTPWRMAALVSQGRW